MIEEVVNGAYLWFFNKIKKKCLIFLEIIFESYKNFGKSVTHVFENRCWKQKQKIFKFFKGHLLQTFYYNAFYDLRH